MRAGKSGLAEVVSRLQVFRMEKGRWPAHAAELLVFSRMLGEGLDLSGFHQLILRREGDWSLSVEYALAPKEEGFAACGRLGLSRAGVTDQETLFQWKTHHEALPARRVESPTTCFIG